MERFGFAPGLIGQAFLLRGPESYVEVSGVPPWTTASHDNWSESIWAKFETGSKEAILHQASLKKGGEVSRFYRDRRGRLAVAVGSSLLKGAAVLEPGVWHHAVATRRGQTVTLYVNGKQDASGELPLSPTDVLDTTLRFGPMKGLIDEIAMFNRTLTAEEVTELYDYTRTCLTAPVR
jgi:hypothetical protein